jgi:hypothetical protein
VAETAAPSLGGPSSPAFSNTSQTWVAAEGAAIPLDARTTPMECMWSPPR